MVTIFKAPSFGGGLGEAIWNVIYGRKGYLRISLRLCMVPNKSDQSCGKA